MKKKYRIGIRVIAVLLAVVVAATTVLHNEELLRARETFSGLQTMLANNQQLTIVEIVDDFSESSMGYLVSGLEPYDVEKARREGTMDDLLADLRTRGLLTTGNADDWNSYPLRYEVTDTEYSNDPEDEALINAGFRRQDPDPNPAVVSGYYELITDYDPDMELAFYHANSAYSEDDLLAMSPAKLRALASELLESYQEDGYPTKGTGSYFRFVGGDVTEALAAQAQKTIESTTAGAVAGVTSAAMPGDAASLDMPQPEDESVTDSSDDDGTPSEEMTPSDDDSAASADETQLNDGTASAESQQPAVEDEIPSETQPANDVQQENGAQTESGGIETDSAVSDSASAVIYVEIDANNGVLVASLGNAGVEPGSESGKTKAEVSTQSSESQGGSAVAFSTGGITVTPAANAPAPTPDSTPAASDDAPTPGGTPTVPPSAGTDDESDTNDGNNTGSTTDNTSAPDADGEEDNEDKDSSDADEEDNEDMDSSDEDEEQEDLEENDPEENDPAEDDSEEEKETYSITYRWTGLTEGESLKEDIDGQNPYTWNDPAEWEDTVEAGTLYSVRSEYKSGTALYLFEGDTLLGAYTFSGWHIADSDEILESLEVTGDVELAGEWSYAQYDADRNHRVTYQWVLKEAQEGTLPSGVTSISDIVLKPQIQLFGMTSQPEISCPKDELAGDGVYTVNGDYQIGVAYDAYDANGNLIGVCMFQGWKIDPDGEPLQDIDMTGQEGDIALVGEWLFYALGADGNVEITYSWRIVGGNDAESFDFPNNWSTATDEEGRWPFTSVLKLPNGISLDAGTFDIKPELPVASTRWTTTDSPYQLDKEWIGKKIYVYEEGEQVGYYTFNGWRYVEVNGEKIELGAADSLNPDLFQDITGDISEIQVIGEWTYEHTAPLGLITGAGKAYVYIKDGIYNNDWFRYYVMGLEEKEFGNVNIKLVTYLADGSAKREYGYGTADYSSLESAIRNADLVYLNTNGVWMDENGNLQSSDRRLPVESAKALLERACNLDRSKRMAVILDNSSVQNQVDENVQKVATILRQEDIAKAYASLSEDGMVYESAFTSDGWRRLIASVVVQNDGNFVRDNVYCVSHLRGEFSNSTYSAESVVRPGSMPALANADFENRFTDGVTDAGFGDVYRAIQKENYERAQSGGAQASMDEYVMPATAVAYILNYRDYDPIIYKDKIRVLELEPCRDYTYYYDPYPGYTGGNEFELKMKFAQDWAQDFIAKLNADPDAITIDGMTTSEFCGKILDIYEEYDVIYFGANDGVLKRYHADEGLQWVKSSSAYEGTISADNPYEPESGRAYTYHDGNWYRLDRTGETREVEIFGPRWCYGGWDGSREWIWWNDNNEGKHGWYANGSLTSETCPQWLWEQIHGGQIFDFEGATYKYINQKWYEVRPVYAEGAIEPNGPRGGNNWYDNGNEGTSQWMWMSTGGDGGWYTLAWMPASTYTIYNDSSMNGMLYTHIGDTKNQGYALGYYSGLFERDANGIDVYGFRSSGNDITKAQVEELNNYLQGGSLILLSEDFMITDQNSRQVINSSKVVHEQGGSRYRGILDTSSYVYQFIRGAFETDAYGNDVPKYANLIVDNYNNGELKDSEAFVEALNQQKVVLNLYAAPEAYGYEEEGALGIIGERNLLQKEADGNYYLNYEFIIGNLSAIAPLTTRYDVQLFLDANNDGIYNTATEELSDIIVINAQTGGVLEKSGGVYQLQANVPYRVRRQLPDGYVGSIGWKLMVTQNGNEHIHDSVTGLTAVPVELTDRDEIDPVTGKKIIHVLQIVPNGIGTHLGLENLTEWDLDWNTTFDDVLNVPDFKIDFDCIDTVQFANNWPDGPNPWWGNDPNEEGKLHGQNQRGSIYDDAESRYDWAGNKVAANSAKGMYGYLNLYDYDMLIVGFLDNFYAVPSQQAIDAILDYANTGKSVLFTHDTTFFGWPDGKYADDFDYARGDHQTLSMNIRELCGMDRFGVSVDWYAVDENGVKHDNRSGSPLRTPTASQIGYYEGSDVYNWWSDHDGNHTRDVAFAPNTEQTMMAAQTQGIVWTMTEGYNHQAFDWASRGMNYWPRQDPWVTPDNADCEVSRVNSGVITNYPYDIPETIHVGYTHSQYFQLDLETDRDGDGRGDVVCWYAINSNVQGDWNDLYDFSPNDVRNNYYIYNMGNITYTGVGHTYTGNGDQNALTLDEQKLFVNTFIAAYNAGIRNPSVRIVENGSVNAPDLENVSIPFNGVDEGTAGTYRVYYQVKDNNITQGTRNLSIKYYIGNPAGSDTVTYQNEEIRADLFADGALTTYSADTGLPVSYDQVRSGYSYYVDIPLYRLLGNETFDVYIEVDLTMADDPDRVVAFDVDKLTIAKLKMFSLD